MKKQKLNKALYTLEGIACILIVIHHCNFPGILGFALDTIARIGVPIFFMVSGYFNYNSDSKRIKNKIFKQLKLFALIYLFYIIYCNIENILINGKETILNYNMQIFTIRHLIWFILSNRLFEIAIHLWFLPALVYCYAIKIIFNKYPRLKNYKILLIVLPVIKLIIDMLLIKFKIFNGYQTRNWLFVGLPFFFLGDFIKEREYSVLKIDNKKIYIGLIISSLTLIIERIVFKVLFSTSLQVFTSIYFICLLLFLWCINNQNKTISIIEKIGIEYSLDIYLWHILIIYLLRNIVIEYCGVQINVYILPVFVIIISITFAALKNKLNKNRII